MDLNERIAQARSMLERVFEQYKRPVAMSSFGKDSMVMLDILKSMGKKLPVIFHKETPVLPKKFNFANRVIEQEGYEVYEYPPLSTLMVKAGDDVDVVSLYQIGPSRAPLPTRFLWMPAGIEKPKAEPYLCGLHDFYLRPTGTFEYPWDVTLIGHKSSDTNRWLGHMPLTTDISETEGASALAFPLRHFTDADIWEYTARFEVASNTQRYQENDLDFDNDHYMACTRCLDRDAADMVFCPKLNREIDNLSPQLRYAELERPTYIAKE